MPPVKKYILCSRCDRTTLVVKGQLLCKDCFKQINHKYKPNGVVLTTAEMNYIEEQEQLADFIIEEEHNGSS